MSIDRTGYRPRWTTPCADLFGQLRQVVVVLTEDRRSLLLVLPSDTVRLNEDAAHQLAEDILDAARSLPGSHQRSDITAFTEVTAADQRTNVPDDGPPCT